MNAISLIFTSILGVLFLYILYRLFEPRETIKDPNSQPKWDSKIDEDSKSDSKQTKKRL